MELSEILRQPEGFTPPEVTVKIVKVWPRKAGENDRGPWSFQNVDVAGGKLKLKTLPEFPKAREGQTVTLKANQSKQHGLTGIKVNHEEYGGTTHHQLVITNSCKWEFAAASGNGNTPGTQNVSALTYSPLESVEHYINHLLSVAALTNQITTLLGVDDPAAMQACFATLCIDTKNRNVLLPKTLPDLIRETERSEGSNPYDDTPPRHSDELSDEDIPF